MGVDLSSAVAVITGAGSGIGRATAHSLARRGARVVVTDINVGRANAAAAEIGAKAIAAGCDVTSVADLEAARDLARERFGRIEVVMNNVGVLAVGAVEDIPLEAWQRVVDVNLLSIARSNLVFLLLRQAGAAPRAGVSYRRAGDGGRACGGRDCNRPVPGPHRPRRRRRAQRARLRHRRVPETDHQTPPLTRTGSPDAPARRMMGP